jgi:hypothetical protein
MSNFFSNFNIRLIIINLVGFWFFYYAGATFGFLHDRSFFIPVYTKIAQAQFPERYAYDVNLIQQIGNVSILVAYIVAWFISKKQGWHWINDVVVFVIAILLGNVNWFGWDHLSSIFLLPGRPFNAGSILHYLVPGLIMLALGLAVLFSKRLMRFIDKGQSKNLQAIAASKKARRVR